MTQINESIDGLIASSAKLAQAIQEAATHGFLNDGGTLQELATDVMANVRAVEDEYDVDSPVDPAEDDHLEAQIENDLGDVEGDGGW